MKSAVNLEHSTLNKQTLCDNVLVKSAINLEHSTLNKRTTDLILYQITTL